MIKEPADTEPSVFKTVCHRDRVCNLKCIYVFHIYESHMWKDRFHPMSKGIVLIILYYLFISINHTLQKYFTDCHIQMFRRQEAGEKKYELYALVMTVKDRIALGQISK